MKEKSGIVKCESAQAMSEFLVVFPVFLILVMGIIEFSFLSLAHQNVNYASFNAARAEIVGRKPHFSAWLSLFMLTPHWVEKISPLDAFKMKNKNFSEFDVNIDNKFRIFQFMFDSPCLLEIFGVGDSSFTLDVTLFGKSIKNIEDFLNAIGNTILGAASDLLNSAINKYNEGISDAGYNLPPFIRKMLYAYSFTETDILEIPDPDAPSVKVSVTYYYILKFPVIQSLIDFYLRNFENSAEKQQKIFKGAGDKWAKADEFSAASGLKFIPITHSCTMGNEKKMMLK